LKTNLNIQKLTSSSQNILNATRHIIKECANDVSCFYDFFNAYCITEISIGKDIILQTPVLSERVYGKEADAEQFGCPFALMGQV